ncbi:MAG: TPM domain-containing protein [Anaerolineae bacterium]|nr:TPM domain-containing protein [Anaerolineae bacterium]
MTAFIVAAFGLSAYLIDANARPVFAQPLCGEGSAPDYGFTYDLQQPHWTLGWQDYASEEAVDDVDVILDQLNADSVAQTMILVLPEADVGNRVNCAVHFLRYMKLGLPTGERKDNGFVFLIVVESNSIDVHYGVGLGLPALTAHDLTTLNRAAEDAYEPDHNIDQVLLTLVEQFDAVARSKYEPLVLPPSAPERQDPGQPPSEPSSLVACCGSLCLVGLLVLFLLWVFRAGISFNPSGYGSGGSSSGGWGGGGWSGGGWGRGGSGRGGSPPTRGGSGSGRSGRGN